MKLILIFLTVLMLNSCSSYSTWRESNIEKYDNMSARALCMSFLTTSNENIWQDEKEDVIQKRNIDCSPYVEEARLYIEKDKLDW